MTAEEYIKSNISDYDDMAIMWKLKHMLNSYARLQIEKDRERVKESELMKIVNGDSKNYHPSERTIFLEGAETVLRQLRNREIILD